ncbi:hypothetical protein [Micavibrio aeruginosavorus]|uniref:Uncharacterized protein n=1 Tax=Micavibrio aeruginosavorus EPB TaxID=349215 RepID=M4VXF7_9BACT|nr:hypothetical protein [Micavibrio aeruginosavorus]AGH97874.1 hypothetical protein A11S_1056 [Micavibrio aeruginosavorus EPB]
MASTSDSPFGKLQGAFGTGQAQSTEIDYSHPQADKLRHAAETTLERSAAGLKLVRWAYQNNIQIKVLRHKSGQAFSPENRAVYLGISSDINTISPAHVLELGGALRQAQQQMTGHGTPTADMDPVAFEAQYHAKMLDIIVTMCKIAQELEAVGNGSEFIDSLKSFGHGDIYEAYISNGPGDHLTDVYFDNLEKQK